MEDAKRILIFGNSGSGKSTLAKKLSQEHMLEHLDLDTLAWQNSLPPERLAIEDSAKQIQGFLVLNNAWVIEGCYSDLLNLLTAVATEIIFLDLPVIPCLENAANRPWESHKYTSKKAQDENLPMLLDWIKQYEVRTDTFSKLAHQNIFENFDGIKYRFHSNIHTVKHK